MPLQKMMNTFLKFLILLFTLWSGLSQANIESFLEKINADKHTQREVGFGSNILYLNYEIEDFKSAVTKKILSEKSKTDEVYKFFGFNTDAQSKQKRIEEVFESDKFKKTKTSPGFSFGELRAIYVNYNNMLNNKNINIKKFYGDIQIDQTNHVLSTEEDTEEAFNEYLDALPSEDLINLSTDELVERYYKMIEVASDLPIEEIQKRKIKNKVVKSIFSSWSWFLSAINNAKVISVEEITENNLDLSWPVLHEVAHLYRRDKVDLLNQTFKDEKESVLFMEIYSDIFAAMFMPHDNAYDHYKKIDSIMFTRILAYKDVRHFTVAPLMALKILISKPGFLDRYSSVKAKEDLAIKLVKASGLYLTKILDLAQKLDLENQDFVAEDLKWIVFDILQDLDLV